MGILPVGMMNTTEDKGQGLFPLKSSFWINCKVLTAFAYVGLTPITENSIYCYP